MFVKEEKKMSKTDGNAGYADACRSTIAKKILPLIIVAVLSVSLVSIAIAAEEEFGGCEMCHSDIAEDFATSLHYTGAGMKGEYAKFAADKFGIDMDEYYAQWNCSNCHATTCEKCHVGYEAKMGHGDQTQEITIDTCDQCHFKKQTSTFVGETQAHGTIPIEGAEVAHPADIHYEKGLTCADCHTAEELHGSGEAAATQLEAVTTKCEDCHNSPGKEVKGMPVTQFAPDTPSHKIHGDKLDCTACHLGWAPVCVDCHLDTRKGTHVMIDDFHLAVGADGKIKPFMNMTATYDNATHTGYGAWFPHTVTDKAKECADCHENPEVLCEGCEGDILGEGGSFIPQETIDKVLAVEMPAAAETPAASPAASPAETPAPPGFELIFAVIAITVVVYLAKRRR
jgi:hypothetical protein